MVDATGISQGVSGTMDSFKSVLSLNWIGAIGGVFFKILIFAGLFFAIYWFLIRPLSYKVRVHILAERAGGTILLGEDRGRYIKRKGKLTKFILLYRKNVSLAPPTFESLVVGEKGRSYVYYIKKSEDEYIQAEITKAVDWASVVKIKPIPHEVKDFIIDETQRQAALKTTVSNVEKYAPYAVFIIGCVIVLVMLWMTLGKISSIASIDFSPMNNLADALREFGKQRIPTN